MGNREKAPLRVLHTADIHMSVTGDPACRSLEVVARLAGETQADLVIIAGDLFDHNRVEDDLVEFTVERLREIPAPVIILPGNHDPLVPGCPYERGHLWEDSPNIHIMRSPVGCEIDFPDLGVRVWGKAHDSYDGKMRPLSGMPCPEADGRWNIIVAHGYYSNMFTPVFPSYNITREEIIAAGWDYVALGHVASFECVCEKPPAYYAGSPALTRTVALVDMCEESGVHVLKHVL